MRKYFAGIGSRDIIDYPKAKSRIKTVVDKAIANKIYLRSGGAIGADTIFENCAKDLEKEGEHHSHIFLPWKDFNSNKSMLTLVNGNMYKLAAKHHPVWDRLSGSVKRLFARNTAILLGYDLDEPVQFVAYWKESEKLGGTDHTVRIAQDPAYNIKCFNLFKDGEFQACLDYLDTLL